MPTHPSHGATAATEPVSLVPVASRPQPRLGSFRLLRLVGTGSASAVYHAQDERSGALVALKVLIAPADETAADRDRRRERFGREAALSSTWNHPNLVHTGGVEEAGDWMFYPMAYVEGPSLARLIRRDAPVPGAAAPVVERGVRIDLIAALAQVAHALHYLHARGIVHRDVTPENILFDARGCVALADYGSIRELGDPRRITRVGEGIGSKRHAAPERSASEDHAQARSDVYALGCVLYEILTGRVPQPSGATALAVPLAPRVPGAILPEALERIVLRAIAPDPAARFPWARDFAIALEDFLGGSETRTIEIPAESPWTRTLRTAGGTAGRWWVAIRSRVRAHSSRLCAAACAGVLLAGLQWAPIAARPLDAAPDPLLPTLAARFGRMAAARSPWEYDGLRTELGRDLARSRQRAGESDPELTLGLGRFAFTQGNLDEACSIFAQVPSHAPCSRQTRFLEGMARRLLALRHAGTPTGERHETEARTAFLSLYGAAPTGAYREIAAVMLQGVEDDPEHAFAVIHDLSRTVADLPELALLEAQILLASRNPKAALALVQTLEQDRPSDAYLTMVRIEAQLGLGEIDAAIDTATRAGQYWPELAEAPLWEARARLENRDNAGALPLLERATELEPGCTLAQVLRGGVESLLQRPDRAIESYSRALAEFPGAPEALFGRARAYLETGDRQHGERDLRSYLGVAPAGAHAAQARAMLTGK